MASKREIAAQLRPIRERCVVDPDRFEEWLSQRGWGLRGLDAGGYGVSLEGAQLWYVCEDPVLWCRAFMTEPDTGEPYTFFDYQEPSVRSWQQDVIHQDGAEVGKTREIVALCLWGECTAFGFSIQKPYVLVGAPQQTHLDEIIMAIEEHVGEHEGADGRKPIINKFWMKPKKTPHYLMRFRTPMGLGRIYFRPAGHDGESFRGVHVNALGLFDEAAKAKTKVIWSEFHRSLMPGCKARYYSVPDGDNTTEFYRMSQEAVPSLRPGEEGLRLFHWPKTLMPDPFWNDSRRREFIKRYNGEDAPGYQRNVLGLHGQQENPVWSWETLEPNVRDVPEYVTQRIHVNASGNDLHTEAYHVELRVAEGKKSPREQFLFDRHEDLADYQTKDREKIRAAVQKLVRGAFEPLGQGIFWIGADLGFSKDPTEIRIWRELGTELRCVGRIHAKGVTYTLQCEIIHAIDEILGFQAKWGVDFGNAGAMVVQLLQNSEDYADAHYDERMTGFQFSAALDAVDEGGTVLQEPDPKTGEPKPIRLPAKELATNLITKRLQSVGFTMPFDADVIGHYTNHTAKEGAKHRIFSKQNDHTIDADRVMILRKVFDEQIAVVDAFASGVNNRNAA